MSMHLSMHTRVTQRLEQHMNCEQRLEMRVHMLQRTLQSVEGLREGLQDAPNRVLPVIIERLKLHCGETPLRLPLLTYLNDPIFCSMLLDESRLLAVPTQERLTDFSALFWHRRTDGRIQIAVPPFELSTTKGLFVQAAREPARIEEELASLRELSRVAPQALDSRGGQTHLEELQSALLMNQALSSHMRLQQRVTVHALNIKDETGQAILLQFLRDKEVVKRLTPSLSQRMQQRFVRRCLVAPRYESALEFQNAALNTLAEHALVTLGIIDPGLFDLQKKEISQAEYDMAKDSLSPLGLDLEELLHHYRLSGPGMIFWNRWAVTSHRPNRITDQLVRAFITETVRKDSAELLESLGYRSLHEQIQGIMSSLRRKELQRDEAAVEIQDVLVTALTEEKFQDTLLGLMTGAWYQRLEIFFSKD